MTQSTILIVDDQEGVAQMLNSYLTGEGFHVKVAHFGDEALTVVENATPDLIMMDPKLPDMDGYVLFNELRSLTAHSRTPIIFLAQQNSRDERITALEMGAYDFITKPFDIEELHLRVANAIRSSQRRSR